MGVIKNITVVWIGPYASGGIVAAGEMGIWLLDLNNFGLYLNKTVRVSIIKIYDSQIPIFPGRYYTPSRFLGFSLKNSFF
jgi:hypothetical protein